MSYNTKILTSIYGRRLGLQLMSTNETGSGRGPQEFLVGPEALRVNHSTADSTGSNLLPYGVSVLTTASSSGVYTLDPPIPGVEKVLVFATTGSDPIYVKTANAETIVTTQGSSNTTICSSQTNYAAVRLVPTSTSRWVAMGAISSGFLKLSTTT